MKRLGMMVVVATIGVCPALAQGDDPQMACVSALADKMAVSMDQVSSLGTKRVGEGTQVTLRAGDSRDRWLCYVNDSGEVTGLEEVPAKAQAKSKRKRR